MPGGRSYSSTTRRTTTTVDPGTSGTTLTVTDSTVFSSLDGEFPWTALINWGLSDQEIVNVTARPSGTTLTVQRGQDGTSGVAHATGATVDHGVSARDFSVAQLPGACQTLGHSYFAVSGATFYQTGRADMQLHSALRIGYEGWKNRAVSGSMLAAEGRSQGGWGRVMQEVTTGQRNAPYVSDIGASVLCWGINDIGKIGGSTQTQINTMFGNALRAVISRCRAGVVFDDGFAVGTRTTYGAGFSTVASGSSEFATGDTLRQATTTTSATITCTLPSDYAGETVALQFVVAAGAGGTLTLSGTAGATGTISLSSIVPSGAGTHVPVVRRVTNLDASDAGLTIVATVTAVTTSVLFDAWWLESKTPPPVVVSNCARVLTAGYAIYGNTIGDTEVANLNTTISGIVNEFDGGQGMVRIADIDTALNKDALNLAGDGLHPNERGASLMASAYMDAFRAMVPTDETNQTANFNSSSMRWGVPRKTRLGGQYYSVDAAESWITANPVSGQMWAAPFLVTNPREWYNRLATRLTNGGSSAGTIRWGVYDDPDWRGYPKTLQFEATSAGAMSLGTTPGIVQNPASGTGSISWTPDPGLYWLVYKQITQGTDQAVLCLQGPDRWGVMPQLDPSTLAPYATPIAYVLGGQGSTALPNTYPLGAAVDYVFPVMALMAANTGP